MLATLLGPMTSAKERTYILSATTASVTTEDFVRAMTDASGADFSQFQHWYDQAGTPIST